MFQLPLQDSNIPKAFDPASNPGGPASGSAGPAPSIPKPMPKGPPPKAEPASLAILLCLFLLARDDSQIIGWMDGFYYRGFDS